MSPLATITEDSCSIDFMVPFVRKNISLVYVCQNTLKCFKFKSEKSVTLLENSSPITAIC